MTLKNPDTLMESIVLPDTLNVQHSDHKDFTATAVSISAQLNPDTGKYQANQITLNNIFKGLTRADVTKLPVATLIRQAGPEVLAKENTVACENSSRLATYFRGTNGRAVKPAIADNPTENDILEAAAIYKIAVALNDYPLVAISRCFGIYRMQASKWAKSAREMGLL